MNTTWKAPKWTVVSVEYGTVKVGKTGAKNHSGGRIASQDENGRNRVEFFANCTCGCKNKTPHTFIKDNAPNCGG